MAKEAKTPMKIKSLALVLMLVAAPAVAQIKAYTVANLPVARCEGGELLNKIYMVTDADGAVCDTDGGSSYVLCVCSPGGFIPLAVVEADLTAYVPKTVAAPQSIEATGAGNDATLSATDDIFLLPGDRISFNSAGSTEEGFINASAFGFGMAHDFGIMGNATSLTINIGNGQTMTANGSSFSISQPIGFYAQPDLPTCDSTLAPVGRRAIMVDTTTATGSVCMCDGSTWVLIGPAGGTCV